MRRSEFLDEPDVASELDETTGLKNCWTPIDERDDEETARNNHGSLLKEN